MLLNLILLLDLIAYSFIVSQPLYYMLALSPVQQNMDAQSYITLRKMIDEQIRTRLKYAYISALLVTVFFLLHGLYEPSFVVVASAAIALMALLADLWLIFRGDVPINDVINGWTTSKFPPDWTAYRSRWFYYFRMRQVAAAVGFGSLLVAAVFN